MLTIHVPRMWDKLVVVCTHMWMVKAEPSSRSRYTNYLYWAYSCSLYWWMCWRLRYETTHQEQWCSHTVSTAEKSCGHDRVLWDFNYKVRGDSGIRINRLKPLFTDIRCDVKQEGDRKNVNIPRYDVDNVTTMCVYQIKFTKQQTSNRFSWASACEFVCEWFSTGLCPFWWVRVVVMVVVTVAIRVWMISWSNYNSNPGYWMRFRMHWRWKSYRV